jgi:uncharacterized protein YjdB
LKNSVEYKNDENIRWKNSTQLNSDQVKKLIDLKVKRARLLSEAIKRLNKST